MKYNKDKGALILFFILLALRGASVILIKLIQLQ